MKCLIEREWHQVMTISRTCPVRTYDDCYDGNAFHLYMDEHPVESAHSRLVKCWGIRGISGRPTWAVLSEAIPAQGPLDFCRYEALLKGLILSKETVNNGNFRKMHIEFYKFPIRDS